MKFILLFIVSFLLYAPLVYAQEVSEECMVSDTLQVYFRQDEIVLDTLFRDNAKRLNLFVDHFNRLRKDPSKNVKGILIVSGASPEGTYSRNLFLSENRAKVVYNYLIDSCFNDSLSPPPHVEIESRGVDWEGLGLYLRESEHPYRNDVLEIISHPDLIEVDGRIVDKRKTRLLYFQGGAPWRELYDLYFADLRGTKVMVIYDDLLPFILPPRPAPVLQFDPMDPPIFVYSEPKKRKPYLALETNMLFDAILIPNIGAELGIYKGLSISANYQNIWLRDKEWTQWYRWEGFELGLNCFINKVGHPFRGNHIGIYTQMMTWDFTFEGRGYLAERWTYGAGLSYGYALPLGERLSIDFELGLGFLYGNMHEYIPQDGHRVWQSYEPFQWIGITKTGATLQFLIDRTNEKERREEQ